MRARRPPEPLLFRTLIVSVNVFSVDSVAKEVYTMTPLTLLGRRFEINHMGFLVCTDSLSLAESSVKSTIYSLCCIIVLEDDA